ncbi:MAG: metallophosphoesterase [Frankiales bacterium]|nr:metallophosphoesterase [Frankiales bacterium]
MTAFPPLTLHRRLGPGRVLRSGAVSSYRAVAITPGEPHVLRDDLLGDATEPPGRRRPLLVLAHVTDLQLADVQSPGRFEFLNREFADPRYARLVPVQRPQEALTAHAIDATLRTLNRLVGAPVTGAPLQLVVTTGDAIDNAQWNELQMFLALFDGGCVRSASGGSRYDGVQSLSWPDDIFWRPDGDGQGGPDLFRRDYGFPHHPGLLERALADFSAAGLQVPWLACFGNHEILDQGVGLFTEEMRAALVGDRKPYRLTEPFDHDQALATFIERPDAFLDGPSLAITPDPDRRAVSRAEFVEAHFRAGSRPYGHGFTEQNRTGGTVYYLHDEPAARLISLDTNCLAGSSAGCLDRDQARWLEERLIEVHGSYRTHDGGTVRTGNEDRLVVLFSHHGIETLTNQLSHTGPDRLPLLEVSEILALLHRFPNVVLWLNGHTHTNSVRPRPDPDEPGRGFWEVTTCAVMDWPCQTRIVELADAQDGTLSILCTMLDHDGPASAAALDTVDDLAALHRELAANVPWSGFDSPRAGAVTDRNVELRLRAPFPLGRVALA